VVGREGRGSWWETVREVSDIEMNIKKVRGMAWID